MDIIKNEKKILTIIIIILVIIIAIAGASLYAQNILEQTNNSYTHETENVADTQAPDVTFLNRYVITNDLEIPSFDNTIKHVYDASEWSANLIRFEYKGNLQVMDETALKSLTDTIPVPCDAEELKGIGTEEFPTEEGIYRAVLEIVDVHGNATLEEVYVIYDTTGARIDETPDKTITVATEDLDKEPVVDQGDYIITDNVDGKIAKEQIKYELELHDIEKHEWLVHVSYIDRAGNESKADFLIIVEEDASATANDRENANNTNNSGFGNDGITSNNGNTSNSDRNDSESYNPADTNKDGVVDGEEASAYISPYEQMVIDAGYGNVVDFGDGEYGVLTHGDGYVNGKDGSTILREYLATMDLEPQNVSGCWIRSDNDWYWYIAKNVRELITPDEEEFWD